MTRFLFLRSLGLCALVGGCAANDAAVAPKSASLPVAASAKVLTPAGTPNFTSKDARFAIYFPVKPVEKQSSGTEEWGKYQTFVCQARTETVSYIVVATTIPEQARTRDSSRFLDGLQKGFLKGSRATLQKSGDITLNGTPGRELLTRTQAGGQVALGRVYLFYTGQMSYQVMAVGLQKGFQSQSAAIEKVLGSFRLLG